MHILCIELAVTVHIGRLRLLRIEAGIQLDNGIDISDQREPRVMNIHDTVAVHIAAQIIRIARQAVKCGIPCKL